MRKKIYSTVFFMLGVMGLLFPQTLHRPLAAAYTATGAYSMSHTDVFSFTANTAALAQLQQAAAGLYGERPFFLSDLNHGTAVIGIPAKSGNFGLKANYYGNAVYKETQIGLAYARHLGKKLDAGLQFNYNSIRISAGYGNAGAISFDAGCILHITDKLHAGLYVNNPVGGKLGKNPEEKIASQFSFGMGYEASDKFCVSAEIVKEEERPVNVNACLQYKFISRVRARAGISTSTTSAWFGFGLTLNLFRLDMTASYHPQLGITPGLLLLYAFKPETK